MDATALEKYTGRFVLAPNFIIQVTREGDQLYAQATGQPMARIFAESPREFFYKVIDAQITFAVDASGQATSLVLHQNGADMPGNRIGAAIQRHEEKLDAAVLEKYTGRYELAPSFIMTVTREGDQLYAQLTDQPVAQIFAESPREFFYKVVDAQVTFVVDESGQATSLVLHQSGRDMPAKRIE